MTSHYDLNTEMFIAVCKPVLTSANRDALLETDSTCFCTAHKLNLKLVDFNRNSENFLGRARLRDMLDKKTLYEMVAPEYMDVVAKRHRERNLFTFIFIFIDQNLIQIKKNLSGSSKKIP